MGVNSTIVGPNFHGETIVFPAGTLQPGDVVQFHGTIDLDVFDTVYAHNTREPRELRGLIPARRNFCTSVENRSHE